MAFYQIYLSSKTGTYIFLLLNHLFEAVVFNQEWPSPSNTLIRIKIKHHTRESNRMSCEQLTIFIFKSCMYPPYKWKWLKLSQKISKDSYFICSQLIVSLTQIYVTWNIYKKNLENFHKVQKFVKWYGICSHFSVRWFLLQFQFLKNLLKK